MPNLRVRDADPHKDREALVRLARWCGHFSPYVAPWPGSDDITTIDYGITLDIEGCAHLFDGEDSLARMLVTSLHYLGFEARLAIADTIGAAYALARYGSERIVVVPPGEQKSAIAALPVMALRVDENVAAALRRLRLKRIGDLGGLPRASLTQRFGSTLVLRLRQAFGDAPEPLSPLLPHASYRASIILAEPIFSQEHVLILVAKLASDLAPVLRRDGKGARELRLTLYRVDGEVAEMSLRLARALRDPQEIVKLVALKLSRLADEYEAGFGYEAAWLDVTVAETIAPSQNSMGEAADQIANSAALIDRLGTRLGIENIIRLRPLASHIPERAVMAEAAAFVREAVWEDDAMPLTRPLLMLPCVEPVEVVALLPEGPPQQFRWRGVLYGVESADGPERIRPEWWRLKGDAKDQRTRDYYVVEDEDGHRFWLYRDGLYNGSPAPRWFMHGMFA